MTHTKIFKILQAEPRKMKNAIGFYDRENDSFVDFKNVNTTNWETDDVVELNEMFKKTIQSNYDLFVYYKHYCKNLNAQFYHYMINNRKYKEKTMCKKYNEAVSAYEDTFNRDFNAFYQEKTKGDADINVCILFDDYYNYLGHIYCWVVGDLCMGFGIRAKIDNFFNKTHSNVSLYLLEGLRKFAIANNCNNIFIPDPLPNMEQILKKHGFVLSRRYQYNVRNKFMGYSSYISISDHNKNYLYPSIVGFTYKHIATPFIDDQNYGFNMTPNATGGKKLKSKRKTRKTRSTK